MLSLSAEISETSVDLGVVNGEAGEREGGVAHALALMRYAEAVARRVGEAELAPIRAQLAQEAGVEAMVDAAAVAGNFQRMVRIADSIGIPLDDRNMALSLDVRKQLDLGRFHSAGNSSRDTLKTRLLSLIARPMAKRVLSKVRE